MTAKKTGQAKKRSAARKAAKRAKRIDQGAGLLGWRFWLAAFAVLAPIAISLSVIYRDPYGGSIYYSIMLGVFFAAVGAGLLSIGINYLLEKRAHKRKIQARKASKKRH